MFGIRGKHVKASPPAPDTNLCLGDFFATSEGRSFQVVAGAILAPSISAARCRRASRQDAGAPSASYIFTGLG